jgi:large subunit ribosomal protein L13
MRGSLTPLIGKRMKTYMAKKGEVAVKWLLVDASDQVLGRLAVKIARILMGKHRPEYTPHVDTGDFVVVINAAKVKIVGAAKLAHRDYQSFSGYPGGQKSVPLKEMFAKHPEKVISEAIRRMMPKNKLAVAMLKKLKIYPGSEHPHQAQQPQPTKL